MKPGHLVLALAAFGTLVVFIKNNIREGEDLAKFSARQLRMGLGSRGR